MHLSRIESFTKGWIVGDFDPSLIKTPACEFAVKYYSTGDTESAHVHRIADEVTVIVSGLFQMNGKDVRTGDVVWLKPGEPTDFLCLEAGATAVIKMPSVKGDKYLV